ncbi:amphi-Trp domain-containing protein [Halobacterium sp. R2-5]|uniref:amphi-Trp domain-containing protein n=1 Tax=Halobacterium sp. R2-5 TaxID=2715751 RepID=UPI0014212BFD|nr:amphi-Trp domain-containing protein [Halobacterium sp. R2-5]NIB98798.1 amphi-Trp domain-containing protein [Halobacterium sp. R2-5]
MAERTTGTESLERDQAAARLEEIAESLRSDDFTIRVDNKDIKLRPTDTVDFQIDVIEKQAMFRGDRETVEIELDWRPK